MNAVLLAHQGGWDEVLLIAGPVVVIGGLLWLARRRVAASAPPTTERGPDGEPGAAAGPPNDHPNDQASGSAR